MTRVVSPGRFNAVKRWSWALVDVACWWVAVFLAAWLRREFDASLTFDAGTALFAAGISCLHVILGALIGPYAVGHLRGSFDEVVDIARTTVATTALGFSINLVEGDGDVLPRSVPLTSGVLALTFMFALRFAMRTVRSRRAVTQRERRAVVFGAGEGGRQLLRTMVSTPEAGLAPVALLDDDPRKARLRIEGIRVRGTREDLPRVAGHARADTVIVAIPSADAALIRDLRERADAADLDVLVLPPISEMLGTAPTTRDLRDIDLRDLLGRRPVHLDTEAIAGQITDKVVLVTGAGGSIGSELCRQIAGFQPRRLYLLDRDESGLHATQLSLTGSALLDSDDLLLADIRDADNLEAVFQRVRPDLVFHAAALKHLPLLETFPLEAWKTNVLGTLNVLTAAHHVGVETFVNISTDKAADPTCVLGYSKRIAERITAAFAHGTSGRYVSVRFGNVLGSRGSVLHAFTAQIHRGGPVTITHPDVRRYFMLIPEACQLVLEAATIGNDGEVLVLDMGEQVRIAEVAQTLIRMSGRTDVEIAYTGLRTGEKLAEDLFAGRERRRPTAHPLVTSLDVPVLDGDGLRELRLDRGDDIRAWLRRTCQGAEAVQAARVAS